MEKPIKYAEIPEYFDETKHFAEQLPPVDMGEYIFIDVIVKDLPVETNPIEPIQNGNFEPYAPEPTTEQRVSELETLILQIVGVI